MKGKYDTPQEQFWAGDFGDAYVGRNRGPELIASRTALFTDVLKRTRGVECVCELGANIGSNLEAIGRLLPRSRRIGVEINERAHAELAARSGVEAVHGSILEMDASSLPTCDLVFTAGVLIHIAPERLGDAYRLLWECSRRYVCVIEYYNPVPVQVRYRGNEDRLFKRDFAGDMLDRYQDLTLLDYGFQYHRDPNFPADDTTWFLLEKRSRRAEPRSPVSS